MNTWLALTWEGHAHHRAAATWFEGVVEPCQIIFSRYSQLGLLRLVTNAQVMGDSVITLEDAFAVYDRLLDDSRIRIHAEPERVESLMRTVSRRFVRQPATKAIGDLYLTAFAIAAEATMVTFDKAMARGLRAGEYSVVLLA